MRDRLEKELVDQAVRHTDQVKKLEADEAELRAKFKIEHAGWAEREKLLDGGYSVIEDILDGMPFLFCSDFLLLAVAEGLF